MRVPPPASPPFPPSSLGRYLELESYVRLITICLGTSELRPPIPRRELTGGVRDRIRAALSYIILSWQVHAGFLIPLAFC